MRSRITIALLSAGVIALGGLTAACASVDNAPQAKRTVTERTTTAAKSVPAPEPAANQESTSEANARAKAGSYLDISAFSRKGLIKQLEFEGFSTADATYGVGAVDANWNEQAALKAKSYLDLTSFSRSGLVTQLKFEGFTDAQAEYGASKTGL